MVVSRSSTKCESAPCSAPTCHFDRESEQLRSRVNPISIDTQNHFDRESEPFRSIIRTAMTIIGLLRETRGLGARGDGGGGINSCRGRCHFNRHSEALTVLSQKVLGSESEQNHFDRHSKPFRSIVRTLWQPTGCHFDRHSKVLRVLSQKVLSSGSESEQGSEF